VPDESLPVASPEPITPPTPPAIEEDLSLSAHEDRFHKKQDARTEDATPPAETPPPPAAEPEPASAETDERDDKGRFLPKRHRAKSQEAGPDDVPRIRELTARLRAAEAERDALKAQTSGPLSSTGSRRPEVPPAPLASAPPSAPKPDANTFSDYGEYLEALTDWKVEQRWVAAEAKRQEETHRHQVEADRQRAHQSWVERKAAARAELPDFDEVAMNRDTPIPEGSVIDAWIWDHPIGPKILYHLHKHPAELEQVLAVTRPDGQPDLFKQLEMLALLSQRLNGSPRTPAAPTGSAAASPPPPAPRPPNPVRTGPLRSGDEPPDEERASLADHEKYYQARRRRG
jgi:hypothetical protein